MLSISYITQGPRERLGCPIGSCKIKGAYISQRFHEKQLKLHIYHEFQEKQLKPGAKYDGGVVPAGEQGHNVLGGQDCLWTGPGECRQDPSKLMLMIKIKDCLWTRPGDMIMTTELMSPWMEKKV